MFFEVKDLSVKFGKAKAVSEVSLHLDEGEIVSIIGANGSGKSTIIRTISGLKRPASGEIWFQDKRIDKMAPHDIVKLGIVQVPAGRLIVSQITVLDNLKIGAYLRKDRQEINKDLKMVYEHFPILKDRENQKGGQLSGGQQQMLAVGRALMARPKLMMMDEPSVGLSPILVAEVGRIINQLNQGSGITILLVEQNCRMALKLAKRAYILELGNVSLEGESSVLAGDERVQKVYLGG
jgi:branched-chain amino acid transport system ATP-binding protein